MTRKRSFNLKETPKQSIIIAKNLIKLDNLNSKKTIQTNLTQSPTWSNSFSEVKTYTNNHISHTFYIELPEPILTYELYESFLKAPAEVPKYNELLAKIPPSHQVVCEMLLYFLSRVLNHKAKNTLEFDNLAGKN